jgi:hypothetical protein
VSGEQVHIEVSHAPARCPFCHGDVDPDARDWLACAHCLARHHTECWGETGRCGTCGREEALGRVAAPPPPKVAPQPARSATAESRSRSSRFLLAVSYAAMFVGVFVIALAAAPSLLPELFVILVLALIVSILAWIGRRAGRRTRAS